jgi:hypothetical protein
MTSNIVKSESTNNFIKTLSISKKIGSKCRQVKEQKKVVSGDFAKLNFKKSYNQKIHF